MGLMHQYGSLGVPQTPKSHNAQKEVFKFIRNKLHFCTYIESEMLKIYFEVCEPFRRSQPSVCHLNKALIKSYFHICRIFKSLDDKTQIVLIWTILGYLKMSQKKKKSLLRFSSLYASKLESLTLLQIHYPTLEPTFFNDSRAPFAISEVFTSSRRGN